MSEVKFKGVVIPTSGQLPSVGDTAPDFILVDASLQEKSLGSFGQKKKVLSLFPSIDTELCALSVKKFHDTLAQDKELAVINISKDLPFAQVRFCAVEGLENIEVLSAFRSSFSKDYGVEMVAGPLAGLLIRAVLILDENNTVIYKEVAEDITKEINYEAVYQALGKSPSSTV